jgi:hypothetical protein
MLRVRILGRRLQAGQCQGDFWENRIIVAFLSVGFCNFPAKFSLRSIGLWRRYIIITIAILDIIHRPVFYLKQRFGDSIFR